jgi:hypothetical protein
MSLVIRALGIATAFQAWPRLEGVATEVPDAGLVDVFDARYRWATAHTLVRPIAAMLSMSP